MKWRHCGRRLRNKKKVRSSKSVNRAATARLGIARWLAAGRAGLLCLCGGGRIPEPGVRIGVGTDKQRTTSLACFGKQAPPPSAFVSLSVRPRQWWVACGVGVRRIVIAIVESESAADSCPRGRRLPLAGGCKDTRARLPKSSGLCTTYRSVLQREKLPMAP